MIMVRRILLSLACVSLPLLAGCTSTNNGGGTPPPPGASAYYTTLASMGVVPAPITSASPPFITLNPSAGNGLATDVNMAFDSNGRLFVVNQALAVPSTISVFTPPLTATSNATFILTMPVVGCAFGIAFDSSNDMWISNCNTSIYEFKGPFTTTGTLSAPTVTLTSNAFAFGLTFDASGNLWVATDTATNGIEEYLKPAGGFVNSTPIDHTLTGLNKPQSVAFDKSGDLFSDSQTLGTAEYKSTNLGVGAAPDFVNPTGLEADFRASQMTFDSAGNLYAADCGVLDTGHIYVYATSTSAFSATMAPFAYTNADIMAKFCAAGIAIH